MTMPQSDQPAIFFFGCRLNAAEGERVRAELSSVPELQSLRLSAIARIPAFPFTARDATPAARMPQITQTARKDRTTRLVQKRRSEHAQGLTSHTGKPVTAILERSGPRDRRARTPQFAPVTVGGQPAGLEPADWIEAIVSSHIGQRLVAEAQT